jgi:hypothetical protein
MSFARDAAFLGDAENRLGASGNVCFLNRPASALFATRLRFLGAASQIPESRVPRWIAISAKTVVDTPSQVSLRFPLWIHHPVYNSTMSDVFGRRIDRREDLIRFCSGLERQLVVLQEHVEGELQKVYYTGGQVVSSEPLRAEQSEFAKAVATISGSDFFGLDYVVQRDSVWAIEMNDWPSFSGHQDALSVTITEYLGR